jgi:hypothetical protein
MSGDSGTFLTCHTCFEQGHEMQDCKEDPADFELVGAMAAFIGARLNYEFPPYNGSVRGGKPISTIRVEQHKEKFWYVRVYCTLADDGLVTTKWLEERERERDGEEPPAEFRARCLRHDAIHYRRVHLDMLRLVPGRLHKRVIAYADYGELLFPGVEQMRAHISELDTGRFYRFDHLMKRYDAKTNDELQHTLSQFYKVPSLFVV